MSGILNNKILFNTKSIALGMLIIDCMKRFHSQL